MLRNATIVSEHGISEGEWWLAENSIRFRAYPNRTFPEYELDICLATLAENHNRSPSVQITALPAESDLYRFAIAHSEQLWTLECHAVRTSQPSFPISLD
ncbi:hypothetical protein [Ferrimonas gelatinilytica]|uniref:Uncharacterized protein n=1 Tax=Ferrimonas gelatinilytica TaxID=1255257 RepID=A0ABP9S0G7_9GAMM